MIHCQEPPSPEVLELFLLTAAPALSIFEGLILGSGYTDCGAFVTLAQGQEFLFLDQGSMGNKNPSTEACLR